MMLPARATFTAAASVQMQTHCRAGGSLPGSGPESEPVAEPGRETVRHVP